MDLYLIRHGTAAKLGDDGITEDEERPLTPEGQDQVKVVAAGLQRRGVRLDLVLSSPLVRAQQTAEGLIKNWSGPAPELRTCDHLAPGGKRRRIARQIAGLGGDALAVVGHEPDLGELAAWLIGSRKANLEIAKAGVACIRCESAPEKGAGILVWLVPPEWLS